MANRKTRVATLTGFARAVLCLTAKADNGPQFRGIGADGVTRSNCPRVWDSSKNVRWKTTIASTRKCGSVHSDR
jgi:hypothetical protein